MYMFRKMESDRLFYEDFMYKLLIWISLKRLIFSIFIEISKNIWIKFYYYVFVVNVKIYFLWNNFFV